MITRCGFSFGLTGAWAALPALASTSSASARSTQARQLQKYAETTHPCGHEAAADPAWRAGSDRLAGDADHLTTEAWIMGLKAQLAWFHDDHTTIYLHMVELPGFDLNLPITATPFFDGLYVTAATAEGAPLLGGKIVRINGVAIERILLAFATA